MTSAAQRADLITELEEVRAQLASDAAAAARQADFERTHTTMYEPANLTRAREAYADAIAAVGPAALAYANAVQRAIDNLRGVQ